MDSHSAYPARKAHAPRYLDGIGVVAVYAVFAVLWILLSDHFVAWLFKDPAEVILASTFKGLLFVAVTTLLLFGLVRRLVSRIQSAHRRELVAAEERQNALQLLAAIADSSDDAIYAKDLNGLYLLFNRAASRIVGKAGADVLGRDDRAIFPPEQAELLMQNDRSVIEANRLITLEEVLTTVGGERTFQATKGPLKDADGRLIGMFGIARDITTRKDAESALQRNVEELQRFNSASVGRELDMIELKRRINALSLQLGQTPPFDLSFVDAADPAQC